jgi:hypothetical protein
VTRSERITVRCTASGGCGTWLLKYDSDTRRVLKTNRRVSIIDAWDDLLDSDGKKSLDASLKEYPWELDRSMKGLVDMGVMIEPDSDIYTVPGSRAPTHRVVRCSCNKRYRIPASLP